MKRLSTTGSRGSVLCWLVLVCTLQAQGDTRKSLDELKALGRERSSYRRQESRGVAGGTPAPRLAAFRERVQPVLEKSCVRCHGPKRQRGNLQIDTLNPDLLHGDDVARWLEVLGVLTNGAMPPADVTTLADDDRVSVIEWLASEIQVASSVRRTKEGHSSFRRMTRYEYDYALKDLLGLPFDFARDLPPEASSDDGFQNSSALLHMTAMQLETYRESGRRALRRATVQGERPESLSWSVSMKEASAVEWAHQDSELEQLRKEHQNDPETARSEGEKREAKFRTRPNGTHYEDRTTGRRARPSWSYGEAQFAHRPKTPRPDVPEVSDCVAIIPPGHHLIVELGDRIPDRGTLRVRVRASVAPGADRHVTSLQLHFGWQASNDSHASVRISPNDLVIDAPSEQPRFQEWDISLGDVSPRNSVRGIAKLGDLPSPSEYIKLVNSSVLGGDIQVDHVEVLAPVHDQWPPASHTRLLGDDASGMDEVARARSALARFMPRAWRREVVPEDLDRLLKLFETLRPSSDSFVDAMVETLATVISSPRFLYLVRSASNDDTQDSAANERMLDTELATRLSMFLWCSVPDDELRSLATRDRLSDPDILNLQIERMLSDPRARRFSLHFVRQWLGMELLDYHRVDREAYPQFDPSLKEAMSEEPVAFFHEVLRNDLSILEFIHSDFTMVNERLAQHYRIADVSGNDFRRVTLASQHRRGGLLTQAGLLAMNSDGKDSHPLKRGVWLLKSILDDPPPPPPPAVPKIDLADPMIAQMTLKERIEHHRDQKACMACHARIDPWGIAFENFDAVGGWRTEIMGRPVDASSLLFSQQKLEGVDGLKRFLLEFRQDQFARALVHKMTTFALGRPLTFGDRRSVDQITEVLRKRGDGLATMVRLIVTSELFRTR